MASVTYHLCHTPYAMLGCSHVRQTARGGGRPPPDPDTGAPTPVGTYGRWRKCRRCEVWLVTEAHRCPCCSSILSLRPRASIAQRARTLAARRSAEREARAEAAAARATSAPAASAQLRQEVPAAA